MIKERIELLKNDLQRDELDLEQVLHKHIIDIDTYLFSNASKDLEIKIRKAVAISLNVHINEVVIVGSAKVGYSLSPKKLYQELDSRYNQTHRKKDKSDIDIAVVSPKLFSQLKQTVYDFTDGLKLKWSKNEYYTKSSPFDVELNYMFYQYNYKGWFRPDLKPKGFEICENGTFEDLKRLILKMTNRKLGLGIYQDWFFFKNYHLKNLEHLKLKTKTELL